MGEAKNIYFTFLNILVALKLSFHDGFPKPRRRENRRRWRGFGLGRQPRSARALAPAGPRDYRYRQGSLFHEKSFGILRVQALSDAAQQRGQLLGPHPGQEASVQLGPKSGQGGVGRTRPTGAGKGESGVA